MTYCLIKLSTEAVFLRCSVKKLFLETSQNSQENTCLEPQTCNFIKKETLEQVFSCKFCEISKNTFSYKTPPGLLLEFAVTYSLIKLKNSQILIKTQLTSFVGDWVSLFKRLHYKLVFRNWFKYSNHVQTWRSKWQRVKQIRFLNSVTSVCTTAIPTLWLKITGATVNINRTSFYGIRSFVPLTVIILSII